MPNTKEKDESAENPDWPKMSKYLIAELYVPMEKGPHTSVITSKLFSVIEAITVTTEIPLKACEALRVTVKANDDVEKGTTLKEEE